MPWVNLQRNDPPRWPDALVAIHVALTFALGYFAFVLALPDETFSASYSFDVMRRAMTEPHWTLLFIGLTLIGTFGLFYRHAQTKLLSASALSFGHAIISVSFFISGIGHPLLPGAGIYGAVAGLGLYLIWRYR